MILLVIGSCITENTDFNASITGINLTDQLFLTSVVEKNDSSQCLITETNLTAQYRLLIAHIRVYVLHL